MLFVGFFGYYPILKGKLEKIRSRALEYAAKFLVFNIAVIASYLVIIYLFGLQGVLEDVGPLGQYSVPGAAGAGNVVFWIYDVALSRIITAYRGGPAQKDFPPDWLIELTLPAAGTKPFKTFLSIPYIL